MKICSTCGKEKEESQYYRDIRNSDGLRNTCKKCSYWNTKGDTSSLNIYEKMCSRCRKVKSIEKFVKDSRRTLGYGMECIPCSLEKECSRCRVRKPLSNFYPHKRSKDGLGYRCKECLNEIRRNKYKNDEEYRKRKLRQLANNRYKKGTPEYRKRNLANSHGLTVEEYDTILEE